MKVGSKIFTGAGVLLLLSGAIVAAALSYSAPCAPAPALKITHPFHAAVARCYGSADVVRIEELERPVPSDRGMRIRVHASSVNPLDWHTLHGSPYIMRAGSGWGAPHDVRLGTDFAGTVEWVGRDVTRFKPGDEVFGAAGGAFSEYVRMPENGPVVARPAAVSIDTAAVSPVAGVTALQALRDLGHLQADQIVAINGAGGGVGTYAVQIAKALGARVTAITNASSLDLVRSLGADQVIDYTRKDFTAAAQHFDLIVDMSGNHPMSAYRRALTPAGTYVFAGDTSRGNWLGPLGGFLRTLIADRFSKQHMEVFFADMRQSDLTFLAELMRSGKVKSVIDRRYSLENIAEAIRYQETGHARGKVLISID